MRRPNLVIDLSHARALELATLAATLYPHVELGTGEDRGAIAVGEAARILDRSREAVWGGAVMSFERERDELAALGDDQGDGGEGDAYGPECVSWGSE